MQGILEIVVFHIVLLVRTREIQISELVVFVLDRGGLLSVDHTVLIIFQMWLSSFKITEEARFELAFGKMLAIQIFDILTLAKSLCIWHYLLWGTSMAVLVWKIEDLFPLSLNSLIQHLKLHPVGLIWLSNLADFPLALFVEIEVTLIFVEILLVLLQIGYLLFEFLSFFFMNLYKHTQILVL